jgi:hypothetical protein
MPRDASENLKRFPVQKGTIPRRLLAGREESQPINGALIRPSSGPTPPSSCLDPDPQPVRKYHRDYPSDE